MTGKVREIGHRPVMVDEVIEALAPQAGEVVIDATFGGGGHAKALLAAAPCKIWAIDRDPDAVARGRALAESFPGRLVVLHGCFGEMEAVLARRGVRSADGITFDLGVSSFQLGVAARGFSFQDDGPLDMRMAGADGDSAGYTAADLVNDYDEGELVDVLRRFGEEPRARRIARAIIARRRDDPIRTTLQLADLIRSAIGGGRRGHHPATRTFQALRIAVNDELGPGGELERGLGAAERLLKPGGRLAVLSFHSLEDREVKQFMVRRARKGDAGSRHRPPAPDTAPAPSFLLPFVRPRRPRREEIAGNPRARSASLRAAIRTEAPAWPIQEAA